MVASHPRGRDNPRRRWFHPCPWFRPLRPQRIKNQPQSVPTTYRPCGVLWRRQLRQRIPKTINARSDESINGNDVFRKRNGRYDPSGPRCDTSMKNYVGMDNPLVYGPLNHCSPTPFGMKSRYNVICLKCGNVIPKHKRPDSKKNEVVGQQQRRLRRRSPPTPLTLPRK